MRGSGGARWQLGGGGRGEAASCLRQVRFSSLLEFNLYLRMPPPDAETLELRSQLEGLVGKLKAKQEEVGFKISLIVHRISSNATINIQTHFTS